MVSATLPLCHLLWRHGDATVAGAPRILRTIELLSQNDSIRPAYHQ